MPYIDPADRGKLDPFIDGAARNVDTVGELTYAFYRLSKGYLSHGPTSFAAYAAVIAALEACKLELYRADVSVYESQKRVENGSVDPYVSNQTYHPIPVAKPGVDKPDCLCTHNADCNGRDGCQWNTDHDGPSERARDDGQW